MIQTGVGKIRKSVKLEKQHPYRETLIFYLLGYKDVRIFWGESHSFQWLQKGVQSIT